ncbi:hypothetical protein L345_08826, partial [Ophiophagus hannah]
KKVDHLIHGSKWDCCPFQNGCLATFYHDNEQAAVLNVMRVEFKSVKTDPSFTYFSINMFSIQPIQVFKGSGHIRNARVLYSPKSEDHCGYQHKGPLRGDDYLISGWIDDKNTLDIKKCDLAIPWEERQNHSNRKGLYFHQNSVRGGCTFQTRINNKDTKLAL